ncbi:MAG: ribbon-helix-helix domain-containing protein [Beijerinckiaceae bacterium]|nr:ribbon-helix-helix domain-containing protein [Beijerinckiaceae bacterium]
MRKHSLSIQGHRTSISLEEEFWTALKSIADRRAISLAALVAEIDRERSRVNLSSALRVFVLRDLQRAIDRQPAVSAQA